MPKQTAAKPIWETLKRVVIVQPSKRSRIKQVQAVNPYAPTSAANPYAPVIIREEQTPPRAPDPLATMWAVEPMDRKKVWYRGGLRIAAASVLALFAVLGVKTAIKPPPAPVTTVQQVQVAAPAFPTAAGTDVASRYVTTYYTITEDTSAQTNRIAALTVDAPGLDATALSASTQNRQYAANAAVIGVVSTGPKTARYTVSFQLLTYKLGADKKTYVATAPLWTAAEVPVRVTPSGVIVATSAPALIGIPAADTPPAATTAAAADASLTATTRPDAEAFFKAYGATTSMSSMTAPGATVAGLGGAAVFDSLTNWSVHAGSAQTRTADADVVWTTPAGLQVRQTYSVTLQRVTTSTIAKWQIAAVHGGNE